MPKNKEKVKRKRGKKFVYKEQTEKEAKTNPFESLSKNKFAKFSKKAEQKIKTEFSSRNSNNIVNDRRIGEGSTGLTEEQKSALRFSRLQRRKEDKVKKFKLDGEENIDTLTHYGKPVEQIKTLNEEISDEEDIFTENDKLISQLNDPNKSKKDVLQQMIADTKQKREERKQKKMANFYRTEALDESFAAINAFLPKRHKEYGVKNDFEGMVEKMIYEERTTPAERIKSKQEQEYEKLILKEKIKQENESSSEEEEDEEKTKKERILSLMEKRMRKAEPEKEEEEEGEIEDDSFEEEESGEDDLDMEEEEESEESD